MFTRIGEWWDDFRSYGEAGRRIFIFCVTSMVLIGLTLALWLIVAFVITLLAQSSEWLYFVALCLAMSIAGEVSRKIDRLLRLNYLIYD